MLGIRSSPSKNRNPDFLRRPRRRGEDNLKWLVRNRPKLERPCLILLGGTSLIDFRLRVAQSHARHSLTPSHWSHVALLGKPGSELRLTSAAEMPIFEISLSPPGGFGFPADTNAVQESTLGAYADPKIWPNCAVVNVPLAMDEVLRTARRFPFQRSAIDAVELVLAWLGYAWGVGRSENPLLDGRGIPAATFVEYVFGALQYELTPGLDSRSSCPEAIWQSALWWHDYYVESGGNKLEGAWVVDHGLFDPGRPAKEKRS